MSADDKKNPQCKMLSKNMKYLRHVINILHWYIVLAHLSQRLKVSYCDRSLSVVRPSVPKLFL